MSAEQVSTLPLSLKEAASPYIFMAAMVKTFNVDSITLFATVVVSLMEAISFTRRVNNV